MLLNLLTVLKNNKSYIWVVSIVDSVFSLIINSFNVKLKMIQEQHKGDKIMSKQKKSEIVNRFRKRFDTKMTELGSLLIKILIYTNKHFRIRVLLMILI